MTIRNRFPELPYFAVEETSAKKAVPSKSEETQLLAFLESCHARWKDLKKWSYQVDLIEEDFSKIVQLASLDVKLQKRAENRQLTIKRSGDELKATLDLLAAGKLPGSFDRFRTFQVGLLRSRYMAILQRFYSLQTDHHESLKTKFRRQTSLVDPSYAIDEKQLEEMLESNEGVQMFSKKITAKGRLEHRKAEQVELVRLLKSIEELHEVFGKMAVKVEQSGEAVSRVRSNVQTATQKTKRGALQMQEAERIKANLCCPLLNYCVLM